MENQLTWRDFLTDQEVADIAALNAARVGFEAEQKLARKRIRDRAWARMRKAKLASQS